MCKAGGVTNWARIGIITYHPNYDKPCVPVEGTYDGKTVISCVFCGKYLTQETQ